MGYSTRCGFFAPVDFPFYEYRYCDLNWEAAIAPRLLAVESALNTKYWCDQKELWTNQGVERNSRQTQKSSPPMVFLVKT